ncbi:hypothetical protein DM02DRAFT_616088 [Periconia macrospinosa]|uniref:Secreted protein n=1 Tax=Periconia macrospinosa TaxID=97972 RepID=A0A2V1DJE9_9PLEO|nr:hypothetical protein DM02DRAFT_616088 [Periconia macrospinosa]
MVLSLSSHPLALVLALALSKSVCWARAGNSCLATPAFLESMCGETGQVGQARSTRRVSEGGTRAGGAQKAERGGVKGEACVV